MTTEEQRHFTNLIHVNDEELDMSQVDQESLNITYPRRTMIQCGICAICRTTENMASEFVTGTRCIAIPRSIPSYIVHCNSKKCLASARYGVNEYFFDSNRFFVTAKTAKECFPISIVAVMRSNGQTSQGEINWNCPFLLNQQAQICVMCELDDGDSFKAVSIESLLKDNPVLKQCWDNTKDFKVAYESQMKQTHPGLLEAIERDIKRFG